MRSRQAQVEAEGREKGVAVTQPRCAFPAPCWDDGTYYPHFPKEGPRLVPVQSHAAAEQEEPDMKPDLWLQAFVLFVIYTPPLHAKERPLRREGENAGKANKAVSMVKHHTGLLRFNVSATLGGPIAWKNHQGGDSDWGLEILF